MAKIKRTVDGLAVITPYDARFLVELKRLVPSSERRWRKPAWVVDPKHETAMITLVESRFGKCEIVDDTAVDNVGGLVLIENRKATVEYIGSCKQRDGGESSAFGWVGGDWNIIFPEMVLRSYFNAGPSGPSKPNQDTLYGLLGIQQTATVEQIKSAYRRAARQWHPDVNNDADAAQVFNRLTEAYQVLSEPRQRKRYDAGLALENNGRDSDDFLTVSNLQSTYRAPYTCGMIKFKGKRQLGRWVVEQIVSWDDIKNEQGQIMVSSWDKLNNTFTTQWLNADFEFEG
jgi:hypothetical protein